MHGNTKFKLPTSLHQMQHMANFVSEPNITVSYRNHASASQTERLTENTS